MDATIIMTGVGTVVGIFAANVALISWLRADMKTFEGEMKSDMKEFKSEIRGWKEEIQKESRDFHARLCVIEETRLNYIQQPQQTFSTLFPPLPPSQEEKKPAKKGKVE